MANPEEAALLRRAKEGDPLALKALVEQHQDDVFYLALGLLGRRPDAEDAMQDVMIKALRALPRFRGDSGFATWLYRITHNTCRDYQRRQRWSRVTDSVDEQPGIASQWQTHDPADDPDRATASGQLGQELLIALDTLTPSERSVFVLRQFQELSTRETAEVLSRAEGSVKNLLFRAMRKLREALADYETPVPQKEVAP
ncbi:MAG: RNA polymerase sigma factor [Pseudomonadota bacterium]